MTTQTRNDGRSNAMLGSMLSNDKFCGITKFSGEDKTYSSAKWAADIEDNAEMFGWNARQKLIVARQSLVGTAQLWLRSEETYKTFEELNAALQNEFPDELNSKEMHEHRYPEEENDSHRYNSGEEELSDSQEMSTLNRNSCCQDVVNKQGLHIEKEKLINVCEKSVKAVSDDNVYSQTRIVKSDDDIKISRDAPMDMTINLIYDIPVAQRLTRLSSMEQKLAEEEVVEWLRESIIEECYSAYSSPLVPVTRRKTRKVIKFRNQVVPRRKRIRRRVKHERRKIKREAIHEIKKMKRKKKQKMIRKKIRRKKRKENAYIEHKVVVGAQGVKIAAKELEKAIAGLNLLVAEKPDEVDIMKEEVARELKSALSSIRLSDRGVYVQASTLGSLEALLEFLRTSKIPYSAIRIGPVVKRDVMKASAMLEHDSQYATILAFDVKIERDAQEMADNLGVKIFAADIIYHLFDKFTAYREELRQRKREEFKHIAVFPCKLKFTAYREELRQRKREEFKHIAVFPCKLKFTAYREDLRQRKREEFKHIAVFPCKLKFTAYREELRQRKREEFKHIAVFPCKLKFTAYREDLRQRKREEFKHIAVFPCKLKFTAYREELRQRKREEFKHIAVFPCKLKILPQFVFNSRDPIVAGVMVEAGIVKEGTPICVPSKEFVDIGIVTSIEVNHKQVETARKGQEVCIKIEPLPGESPKMFGRHFDETDFLVSKISRASIDACKDYFRDDLVKTDWQLMVELKKLFQIL
ncbi:unnamed protein product [Plutella xylostella]|uniref:(diamondback moth) hypothetical protein n=1 Tax=Plutella xylostella TaxID=51655 RepID=A0A8S4G8R3_PLUXY|nr:unnamed protein product [Plutella xylostella]